MEEIQTLLIEPKDCHNVTEEMVGAVEVHEGDQEYEVGGFVMIIVTELENESDENLERVFFQQISSIEGSETFDEKIVLTFEESPKLNELTLTEKEKGLLEMAMNQLIVAILNIFG